MMSEEGLKLNGTRRRLVYADDVNILGGTVHAVKNKKIYYSLVSILV
jgi:hypothetical protein